MKAERSPLLGLINAEGKGGVYTHQGEGAQPEQIQGWLDTARQMFRPVEISLSGLGFALGALHSGRKVARAEWCSEVHWLELGRGESPVDEDGTVYPDGGWIAQGVYDSGGEQRLWYPDHVDLLADDWRVVG